MIYEFAELIGRSRWAMDPASMRRLIASADDVTHEALHARLAAMPTRAAHPQMVGDVAVIDVSGPITNRDSFFSKFFGSATVDGVRAQFRTALADSSVKSIVFRVDSPGGTVDGVSALADEIYRARGQKPTTTVSDTLNASAALWISSQTDQLLVEPSSQTGSIGVLMAHEDLSKMLEQEGVKITLVFAGEHKVDGNPFEPLPDDVRARWQAEIDEVRSQFVAAVARGRRMTQRDVREKYGEGLVYSAKDAVKLGLADAVATFDDAMAMAPKGRRGRMAAETTGLATLSEIAGVSIADLASGAETIAGNGEVVTTTVQHRPEATDVIVEEPAAAVSGAVELPDVAADRVAADRRALADEDYIAHGLRIAERR